MKTKYAKHFQDAIICKFNAVNRSAPYKTSKELHLLHIFIISANGGRSAVFMYLVHCSMVGGAEFDWVFVTESVKIQRWGKVKIFCLDNILLCKQYIYLYLWTNIFVYRYSSNSFLAFLFLWKQNYIKNWPMCAAFLCISWHTKVWIVFTKIINTNLIKL